MILDSDTFEGESNSLGAAWVELSGAPFTTGNFSKTGGHAVIDATGFHAATMVGTSQADQFPQCWVRAPNSSNNVGLIFRYIDNDNFYFIHGQPSNPWRLFRRRLGVTSAALASSTNNFPTNTWARAAVRCVGARIQLYTDATYDTNFSHEGPVIDFTDATPVTGSGPCGITTTGNNATGTNGPRWNDFIAHDGEPETIYVDSTFNGGAVGEGMGTVDRPDLAIDWALNNAGLGRGGKIKLVEATVSNPSTLQFRIGHSGKWSNPAFVFPTYDPENGAVSEPGSPNLTIEGRDGGRTLLNNVQSNYFFRTHADATGIVFRSLDVDLTDTASTLVRTDGTATSEHSIQVAKCKIRFADPVGTSNAVLIDNATTPSERVEVLFNYFTCAAASSEHGEYVDIDRRTKRLLVKFNVFRGIAGAVPGAGAEISYGVVFGTSSDLQASDVADIDHNHFVDIFRGTFNEGGIGILDTAGMAGAIEFQNNIVAGPGAAADDPTTDFGIYTPVTAATGTITAHHNGYSSVTSPRGPAVTSGGNELDSVDPVFRDLNATYLWPHTAGQGLNSEGMSSAITLDRDWRPTAVTYIDTADDSTSNLGVLDRGALQDYIPPGGSSIPESVPVPVEIPLFCPSIVFDRGGAQEYDLSAFLMKATALRYERDVLLRSYRASDVTMEFMDPRGLFVEQNPESFLNGPDGEPDWLGKRVVISVQFGSGTLTQYEGFVLEAEAGQAVGRLRIGNRFQQLFDRPVLANDVVRIVATNNATVHPRTMTSLGSAGFVTRPYVTLNLDAKPLVETLTFEFLDATRFFVTGSVSGYEGEGEITTTFTTLSGSVTVAGGTPVIHSGMARFGGADTIDLAMDAASSDDFYNGMTITLTGGTGEGQSETITDYEAFGGFFFKRATVNTPWATVPDATTTYVITGGGAASWNAGGHTYAEGEKVLITIGWASVELSNPPENDPEERILDIYRDFVTSAQGGQLVTADLDPSVDAMETERGNQLAHAFVVDAPAKAIDVIDELSLHMGAVTIEKANAKIGLRKINPQLIPAGSLDVLCSGDDLMGAELGHLPIYNQFVFSYDWDVSTQKFRAGFVFPERGGDNPSLARYGRLYPAPNTFEARAYSASITDNTEWLRLLSETLYRRYENPAVTAKVQTKVSRMTAELDDTYRLDSDTPTVLISAMEPFAIDKNITGKLTVDMELVDISDLVQEEGACGFLSYDAPGEGYDQCWGYF